MNSILDAVLAAQKRNKREDAIREARQQEVNISPAAPLIPVLEMGSSTGGDGGYSGITQDTRTYQEKYQDAVNANRNPGLMAVMPGGTAVGLYNDYQIAKMEEMYPELRPADPYSDFARSRFSTVGQVALGRGYPTQEGRLATSVWDRLTGTQPTWSEAIASVDYPVPQQSRNYNTGGDGGDTPGDPSGGRASMVSDDDYSGYA